jgi:Sel1 repeat
MPGPNEPAHSAKAKGFPAPLTIGGAAIAIGCAGLFAVLLSRHQPRPAPPMFSPVPTSAPQVAEVTPRPVRSGGTHRTPRPEPASKKVAVATPRAAPTPTKAPPTPQKALLPTHDAVTNHVAGASELDEAGKQYYDQGNYAQAMYYFRQAADQGDAQAQDNVGGLYEGGLGVKQDPAQALFWYDKAAAVQGNADAQYRVQVLTRGKR